MSDPLKRNLEIEAAIAKDPDSLDAYLVYGDWLQDQGDPRGELIALQCMAHGLPRKQARAYLEPARELLVRHEELLLGGLIGFRYKVKWRFGFIDELRMSGAARTRSGQELGPAEFLRFFLALPAARFLRRLEIIPGFEAGKAYQPWSVCDELEKNVYPTLETLVLGGKQGKAPPMAFLGPIRVRQEFFPRLRSLTVREATGRLEGLHLPQLRELKLTCDRDLFQLCEFAVLARLPNLERLVIHGHAKLMGQRGADRALQELLETQELPHLKHLGLNWDSYSDIAVALCQALSRSRLLQQLDSLDLSNNTLHNACADVLLAHAESFKHLRHLDLSGNIISAESRAGLKTLSARVNKKCKGRPFHDP